MTLVKFKDSPLTSFPAFIDNLFSRDLMDWTSSNFSTTNTTLPAVNIREDKNTFEIEVAAPGMTKGDFMVSLENDLLTISSEKTDEKRNEKEGQYSRREFSYQSFQRSFNLPEGLVDSEKISAKYCDGILCITVPKKEEVKKKASREIKIS